MSDTYIGSLEEHVDNDVSGQGVTPDELAVGYSRHCGSCGSGVNVGERGFCERCERELRWSGEFRVIPEPFVEPELTDWQKQRADELFYGHEFTSAYYGLAGK